MSEFDQIMAIMRIITIKSIMMIMMIMIPLYKPLLAPQQPLKAVKVVENDDSVDDKAHGTSRSRSRHRLDCLGSTALGSTAFGASAFLIICIVYNCIIYVLFFVVFIIYDL